MGMAGQSTAEVEFKAERPSTSWVGTLSLMLTTVAHNGVSTTTSTPSAQIMLTPITTIIVTDRVPRPAAQLAPIAWKLTSMRPMALITWQQHGTPGSTTMEAVTRVVVEQIWPLAASSTSRLNLALMVGCTLISMAQSSAASVLIHPIIHVTASSAPWSQLVWHSYHRSGQVGSLVQAPCKVTSVILSSPSPM